LLLLVPRGHWFVGQARTIATMPARTASGRLSQQPFRGVPGISGRNGLRVGSARGIWPGWRGGPQPTASSSRWRRGRAGPWCSAGCTARGGCR